jgi:hypothetical protein
LFKSKQGLAYADDIVLVARNVVALKEMFITLEKEGLEIGLGINNSKTKYMKVSPSLARRTVEDLEVGEYKFESVEKFIYLGTELNVNNNLSSEIRRRIEQGNRAYYANRNLMKCRLISRSTKIKIYQTLIRPVVTYGCEAWVLSTQNMNALRIFERKVLRRIHGPIYEEGEWRIRNNAEVNTILQGKDIVRYIKSRRISWLGHVQRMEQDRMQRQMLVGRMEGTRRRGRPRTRWLQDVERDLACLGVRNWRRRASQRDEWRQIVEEAKVHVGL